MSVTDMYSFDNCADMVSLLPLYLQWRSSTIYALIGKKSTIYALGYLLFYIWVLTKRFYLCADVYSDNLITCHSFLAY
jgi:hypothetical protein